MIRYIVICKSYKKGNRCAKHISKSTRISESGRKYYNDLVILRLEEGCQIIQMYDLHKSVRIVVTNDVPDDAAIQLNRLEKFIESRKRIK